MTDSDSSTKHTPGPWVVKEYDDMLVTGQGGIIAGMRSAGRSMNVARANARLIAAAPDLLEALQEVFDTWFEKPSNIEKIEPSWVVKARTAIDALA